MNNKTYSLFLILLAVLFTTSCTKPFSEKDNGTKINLGIDDPFEIELEGNPSEGFIWEVEYFEEKVIKQLGEPEFTASDDNEGAEGKYLFKFQTIAAGQSVVSLVYHEKSGENQIPAKTFSIEVISGTMGRILED
jgi:predicted secreted protein